MNDNCTRRQPIGWYCARGNYPHRVSPTCALRPRWWNIPAKIRFGWTS